MEFREITASEERERLLTIVLRESPEDDVAALTTRLASDDRVLVGLADTPLLSGLAIAAQLQSGGGSFIWPVQPAETDPGSADSHAQLDVALGGITRAVAWLKNRGAAHVQSLLDPKDDWNQTLFHTAGFSHLADLAYLGAEPTEFPEARPQSRLGFRSHSETMLDAQLSQMTVILERTYAGTQDCPAMSDLQPAKNAIESYQSIGKFDPQNWFLIDVQGQAAGCLILAEQTDGAIPVLELVYMGIVPEVRGRGFGVEIVRFAQWVAREKCAERLVLAVDTNNQPALAMYAECGFGLWGQRRAMIKKLDG
ncbi:MAG: GNAT family N-acetyltransferase [Pirellulales bacterium]|nr:GNAT family N-acetyltransferase [Pirellulales bacterium]